MEERSRWRPLARRWVPWLVAAAVLALLLVRYRPADIAGAMARGDALAVVPWTALVAVLGLAAMSLADWLVFSAFAAGLRWFDVVRGRAGTTILMTLHYGASVGGYGVWLARRTGAGAAASSAAIGYQMLSDLAALSWFALATASLFGDALPRRELVIAVCGAGAAGSTLLLLVGGRLLPRRLGAFARAWRAIGPARSAASLALRLVTLAINVGGTIAAARAFGLDIPAAALAAGLPVVYVVGALPLNVLGLGAVTAAWVAVFEPFAPGAQILAFQLIWQALSIALTVVRGLPFLPSVLRDIARDPG
ncbi:MAG TPA: hypothetical protein VFU21_30035 [Kofleriaceae bacterium]|nr:hypothetical protein [Kofleriaceae bacterium]